MKIKDIEKPLAQDPQDIFDKISAMNAETQYMFFSVLYDALACRGLLGPDIKATVEKFKAALGMYDDKGLNALFRMLDDQMLDAPKGRYH